VKKDEDRRGATEITSTTPRDGKGGMTRQEERRRAARGGLPVKGEKGKERAPRKKETRARSNGVTN